MNMYLQDFKEAFKLIASLMLKENIEENTIDKEKLRQMEKFIQADFLQFIKVESPHDAVQLFYQLLYEFHRFSEFMTFTKVAGKNIVALGGEAGSGKTTFLNSIFNKSYMDSQSIFSTSVPTYALSGKVKNIEAINLFNSRIHLNEDAFIAICQDFRKELGFSLTHMLRSILIEIPMEGYENMVFYDPPATMELEEQSFHYSIEGSISSKLKGSNFIVWVVSAEKGLLTDKELDFLKKIRKGIPILIIVSKSDKREKEDIKEICKSIRKRLDKSEIQYEGVLPFSEYETRKDSLNKIKTIFNKWNLSPSTLHFGRNFQEIFIEMAQYLEEELSLEKNKIHTLNRSISLLKEDQSEIYSYLKNLQEDLKRRVELLTEREENLKDVKSKFFALFRQIGEIKSVALPLQKEEERIKNLAQNPILFLKEYKKERGIADLNFNLIIRREWRRDRKGKGSRWNFDKGKGVTFSNIIKNEFDYSKKENQNEMYTEIIKKAFQSVERVQFHPMKE